MADVAQEAPASTRLSEAIGRLRIQSVRGRINERTLLYAGGGLSVLGLVVVWLGWQGASTNVNLPEQIPYIISGGLLGLAFVFLGGFCYFAFWITRLVHAQQRQTELVVAALEALRPDVTVSAAGSSAVATADLVATAKGTMAHRRDCSVVAGKKGLRRVSEADGLAGCQLCQPY